MFFKYLISVFMIACIITNANAGEESQKDMPTAKIKEPIFFFKLPNRGALAVLLDKGAIKAGTSGSIKSATSTIEEATLAKGSLLLSCEDTHAALAIEKSLYSFADGSLSDLTFILTGKEKCSDNIINSIVRTAANL